MGPPFTLRLYRVEFARSALVNLSLQGLYVFSLPAFGALYDVELNRLAFFQAAKAARLDGGEVYEYIFTILSANKSKPFGVVEPLYCSLFHM